MATVKEKRVRAERASRRALRNALAYLSADEVCEFAHQVEELFDVRGCYDVAQTKRDRDALALVDNLRDLRDEKGDCTHGR